MKRSIVRLAAAVLLAAGVLGSGSAPAVAADASNLVLSSSAELSGRVIHLAIDKSMVIELPEDVRDVLVSNPQVADAVVRSARKIYLIGMKAGEANIFLFGDGNRQLAQFELVVSRDTVGLQAMLSTVMPGNAITVQTIGESIVLSGTAKSAEEAGKAADLAAKFIGDPEKVVNMLAVGGSDQVHLKVVVAEVQRAVIKDLGIDTQSLLQNTGIAFSVVKEIAETAASLNGSAVTDYTGTIARSAGGAVGLADGMRLSNVVKLLNQQGVVRTLAEPTLTAVSGEQASFLAGGEFPIPVSQSDGEIVIEFKQFGISLAFEPVVLSPGRISLKIQTEVSELSNEGAVQVSGLTIPALTVRRANSTVELPSGGSIVMAGLIRDNVRQTLTGYPGLMDLPVLGSLFKSREYQRNQTELAVFVSPYIVNPVAQAALTRPDQNFAPPGDAQAVFLNQLNRVYASPGATPKGAYHGRVGFVYD
ncbi:type II and III secretion system protein family protein [Chthonobacter rhizosphaerae]|uniref:type II and III secretion system protein family protein n=1 Tax=Chthonobacter rhizosphaerae TaxID=2735553 RepID=UPI0015EEDCF8|nr:type II and III secretion system protein family protein [Chthonobacter rhizosphaerae]